MHNFNVVIESYELSKKIECRTSDELTFFKVITPEVIEMILLLEREYPGNVNFCFKEGKCYVGMRSKKADLKLSPQKTEFENTQQIGKNIVLIKEIIEGFGLSGNTFTSFESRYKDIKQIADERKKEREKFLEELNTWG